jgi:hypothetical protein
LVNRLGRSLKQLLTDEDDEMPPALRQCLSGLLSLSASERPDIAAFLSCDYFKDIQSRTVRYLDKLLEKDVSSRIEFFKRLPQALQLFDEATLVRHILPPMLLQMKDEKLAVFVLPSLLCSAERLADHPALSTRVLPAVLKMLSRRDSPQIAFILLKHLGFIASIVSSDLRRDTVLPLLTWSLQSNHPRLTIRTLQCLPLLISSNLFQHRDVRSKLLPRILYLCSEAGPLGTSLLSDMRWFTSVHPDIRLSALECVKEAISQFESETINGPILDALKAARTVDKSKQFAIASLRCTLLFTFS